MSQRYVCHYSFFCEECLPLFIAETSLVVFDASKNTEIFSCLLQVSIPCKKKCYRLYGKEGYPLVDIMTGEDEPGPKVNDIYVSTFKQ
jgi:hypothetical protein